MTLTLKWMQEKRWSPFIKLYTHVLLAPPHNPAWMIPSWLLILAQLMLFSQPHELILKQCSCGVVCSLSLHLIIEALIVKLKFILRKLRCYCWITLIIKWVLMHHFFSVCMACMSNEVGDQESCMQWATLLEMPPPQPTAMTTTFCRILYIEWNLHIV